MADTAGLKPLPPRTDAGGMRPLSNGAATPASRPQQSELGISVAADDPVEQHIAEYGDQLSVLPVDASAPAEPAAAPTPTQTPPPGDEEPQHTPQAEATPQAGEPAAVPAQPTTQGAQPEPPETPTTEAPQAAEPVQPAQAATPEPQKPTFADDERIVLGANADGSPVEWTRAQIREAIVAERESKPLAAEANIFREVFGTDAATAKAEWTPILERFRSEPYTAAFVQQYLEDPAKAEYLQRSAVHFDQERAAGRVQTPQPQAQPNVPQDPVVARELAQLRSWQREQESRQMTDRVVRERDHAVSAYPFLATDPGMWNDLVLTAQYLNGQNAAWGIPEAVAAKKAFYDSILAAGSRPVVAAEPAQHTPPVPALLGSQGASPTGTRPQDNGRPRKYEHLDDATDDWLRSHPS